MTAKTYETSIPGSVRAARGGDVVGVYELVGADVDHVRGSIRFTPSMEASIEVEVNSWADDVLHLTIRGRNDSTLELRPHDWLVRYAPGVFAVLPHDVMMTSFKEVV